MAGLSLALLALVGVLAWSLTRPDTYVAPPPDTADDPRPSYSGAVDALDRLVEAIDAGDPEAAAELAVDASAERQLRAVVDNADALEVEQLALDYVDEAAGIAPDGTWAGAVDATWAFGGFDAHPARTEILVTFRVGDNGSGARIVSLGGGDRHSPIWMSGPVDVRRTPETLVLAAEGVSGLDRFAQLARKAVPVVTRVLPRWRKRLVVEVPADSIGLEAALAADKGTFRQIAAVTSSPDGTTAPAAPVHVFVNPEILGGLESVGAQVVMSHEAAHVATHAPSSRAEPWLMEGIADYIALRDVDLPITTTARQIIAAVREQGLPPTLPSRSDFDTEQSHLGSAYEAAWLVCVVLAERGGEQALVRFYNQTSTGAPPERALRQHFGWSRKDLVQAWRQRLREISG